MRIVGPSHWEDLLWEWARAEWRSPRFAAWYPQEPAILARLESGAEFAGDDLDWRILDGVARARGLLLDGLDLAGLEVHRAVLAPAEIAGLGLFRDPGFRRLCPTATCLGDLADSLAADLPEHRAVPLAAAYHALGPDFDPARMRGRPILLAADSAGPCLLLEGYCRLLRLLALHRAGADVPEIPVMIGLWPELPGWKRVIP